MWKQVLLTVVLLAAGAGGAASQVQQGAQDFAWTGRLESGQTIEIKGVSGTIEAEPATGAEVEVRAVRRAGERGDIEDVRIETVRHGNGVTICAVYPSRPSRRENRCESGRDWSVNVDDTDVRVDFTVRVPRGIHFLAKNISGSIDARDLPADATVTTVSGSIDVSAAGIVEAHTVSGSIDARMGTARLDRDLSFRTVSGSITLRVPANFEAAFEASTISGDIESDFPVRVKRRRWVGVDADGRIGQGGAHSLSMETVSGSIALLRIR